VSIQNTTEFAATSPEVTRAIVQELRTSDRRFRVFEAVYSGGNRPKDASVLAAKTGLTEVAALQVATPMAHKQFFEQVKRGGRVSFRKYPHINAVKQTILRAAKRPAALRRRMPVVTPVDEPQRLARRTRSIQRSAWNSTRRNARRRQRQDVFVCHASEDKSFVRRLVGAIKKANIHVWYDEDLLQWGDGLRSSIDRGLANSKYGIVVFSRAFLKKKHWTEHELNGLFAKERNGRKVILPIWHNITDHELLRYSPAFADRIAMISKRDSVKDIVSNLRKLIQRS